MVRAGADVSSEHEGYLQDHIEEQQFVEVEASAEFEAEMRAACGNNVSW